METPFENAKPILEKLHLAGYEAYYVGGAVRDHLLSRRIGDVDIASSAKPIDIQNLFDHTIDVGAEHGTIIVLHNNTPYEVTTYRAESEYVDFRRPKEVSYITSLKEDLRRRDFTINAMAMDIDGIILDYFNGKSHLSEKLIQTVGSSAERFTEDALRMLRAVRFVSQLDFTLCPETRLSIKDHVHLLEFISVERKTIEIEKLLKGINHRNALEIIIETGMNAFLPGLEMKQDELKKLSDYILKYLKTGEELWTIFTYCIAPQSVQTFLRKWKLPVKLIKAVDKNIEYLTIINEQSWSDFLLYEVGSDRAILVERIRSVMTDPLKLDENVKRIKHSFRELPIQHREQLVITGHDVIQYLNKQPGPWVSIAIKEVEKAIISKKLENNRSAIKEWLMRCKLDFGQNY
jgi:tRNA nucleotidyltransferase (CCA-adding enzyme)